MCRSFGTQDALAEISLLGVVSLLRIQIDLLPNIELPTVTIQTEYAGASPERIAEQVTRVLRRKEAARIYRKRVHARSMRRPTAIAIGNWPPPGCRRRRR